MRVYTKSSTLAERQGERFGGSPGLPVPKVTHTSDMLTPVNTTRAPLAPERFVGAMRLGLVVALPAVPRLRASSRQAGKFGPRTDFGTLPIAWDTKVLFFCRRYVEPLEIWGKNNKTEHRLQADVYAHPHSFWTPPALARRATPDRWICWHEWIRNSGNS